MNSVHTVVVRARFILSSHHTKSRLVTIIIIIIMCYYYPTRNILRNSIVATLVFRIDHSSHHSSGILFYTTIFDLIFSKYLNKNLIV